jgi:hypothetical protein
LAGFELNATFGIATVTSSDFNNFPIDGILGLAASKGDSPTFWETLMEAKILEANLFGVDINRASDGPNDGVINFGAPDTSRFTGSLGYTDIIPAHDGDWAIRLDDVSYDGEKAGIKFNLAYIDTGTSYIFTTKDEVKKLHATVPGSTTEDGITYRVPCTTTKELKFFFSGTAYAVSSKDWVGPMVNGVCTSNVYGHSVVGDGWLLGDTFLKNVYAVFDLDQSRIGFAPQTAPSIESSTTTTAAPISPSKSTSTALPSSDASSVPASSGTTVESSNGDPTKSSTVNSPSQTSPAEAEVTSAAGASPTSPPGLGGHQTSDSSSPESAEASSAAAPTPSNQSGGIRLHSSLPSTAVAIIALLTLIS